MFSSLIILQNNVHFGQIKMKDYFKVFDPFLRYFFGITESLLKNIRPNAKNILAWLVGKLLF